MYLFAIQPNKTQIEFSTFFLFHWRWAVRVDDENVSNLFYGLTTSMFSKLYSFCSLFYDCNLKFEFHSKEEEEEGFFSQSILCRDPVVQFAKKKTSSKSASTHNEWTT